MVGLFSLLSVFVFSFVYWKENKEDYSKELIFNASFLIIFSSLVGIGISRFIFPGLWFWFMVVFGGVSAIYAFNRYNIRPFEAYQAVIKSAFYALIVFALGVAVFGQPTALILFASTALSLVFFYLFERTYRRLSWYPSGRVGFSGFASLAVFSLIRSILAIVGVEYYSQAGIFDAVISACLTITSISVIYILSRNS